MSGRLTEHDCSKRKSIAKRALNIFKETGFVPCLSTLPVNIAFQWFLRFYADKAFLYDFLVGIEELSIRWPNSLPATIRAHRENLDRYPGEDGRRRRKKRGRRGKEDGKKKEISNYRDFLFRNSIPNTIVLASRVVDRTLIPPRTSIVPLETFRNRSLSTRWWNVNIFGKLKNDSSLYRGLIERSRLEYMWGRRRKKNIVENQFRNNILILFFIING